MSEVLWQAADYLRRGGWIMVPLLGCSVVMWMYIIERWHTYRQLSSRDIKITRATRAVEQGKYKGQRPGMRAELIRRYLTLRSGDAVLDREILRQCTMGLRNKLRDRLAAIAVLAAVAPLLGLLGTVLGMIETFNVISLFGTGNAKAMAGGISVALITTQSGLIVAIPGLFISGALLRRARNLETRLDEISTILDRQIKKSGLASPENLEAGST